MALWAGSVGMVAQHVTVVGREDHDCVLLQTEGCEGSTFWFPLPTGKAKYCYLAG